MKDNYTSDVVRIQRKILQCQESGELPEYLPGALANQQRRLETITRKCDHLFFQWNCLGRGGSGKVNPSKIHSDTIIPILRQVWPEISELKGPSGNPLSWDTAFFDHRKNRIILFVIHDQMRPTRQEDWADCEWLDHRINVWLEYLQTPWRFSYQGIHWDVTI